jgi:tetratricopeptide (TPR) repeat protein
MLLAALILLQDASVVKDFEKRLSKAGEDSQAHYKLGLWCLQNDLPDRALERFEKVIELDPEHGDARERAGYVKEDGVWKETPQRLVRKQCAEAVRKGLKLPAADVLKKWRGKGRYYEQALDALCYSETWVQALMLVAEYTGLFEGKFEIELAFRKSADIGFGVERGLVYFDLDRLVDYLKKVDYVAAEKAETEAQVLLPAIKIQTLVTFCLTRVYQGILEPSWYSIGMACYVSRSPYWLCTLKLVRAEVSDISKVTTERNRHFGRGHAFFEWLEATSGREKVREFIKLGTTLKPEEAAPKATGLSWDEIVKKEAAWSRDYIKSQRLDW